MVNSSFRKIFSIKSRDVANECGLFYNCSVSYALYKRKVKFLTKLKTSENIICKLFANNTNDELATLHSIATEQLHLSLN